MDKPRASGNGDDDPSKRDKKHPKPGSEGISGSVPMSSGPAGMEESKSGLSTQTSAGSAEAEESTPGSSKEDSPGAAAAQMCLQALDIGYSDESQAVTLNPFHTLPTVGFDDINLMSSSPEGLEERKPGLSIEASAGSAEAEGSTPGSSKEDSPGAPAAQMCLQAGDMGYSWESQAVALSPFHMLPTAGMEESKPGPSTETSAGSAGAGEPTLRSSMEYFPALAAAEAARRCLRVGDMGYSDESQAVTLSPFHMLPTAGMEESKPGPSSETSAGSAEAGEPTLRSSMEYFPALAAAEAARRCLRIGDMGLGPLHMLPTVRINPLSSVLEGFEEWEPRLAGSAEAAEPMPGPSREDSLGAAAALQAGDMGDESQADTASPFDMLPAEMVIKIFRKLDDAELLAVSRSCKRFWQICKGDLVLRQRLLSAFEKRKSRKYRYRCNLGHQWLF